MPNNNYVSNDCVVRSQNRRLSEHRVSLGDVLHDLPGEVANPIDYCNPRSPIQRFYFYLAKQCLLWTIGLALISYQAKQPKVASVIPTPVSLIATHWYNLEGRIAFHSDRGGNLDIYVMQVGNSASRLTDHPAADFEPAWSPDCSMIAYASGRDDPRNFELYVMRNDGTGQRKLIDSQPGDEWAPSWSPNGKKIAYQSNRDGNFEIYIADSEGTERWNITNHPANDGAPSWSPDGSRLVFMSDRDGKGWEIYVMDADGSSIAKLTDNTADDMYPQWSPAGDKIVFQSNRDGEWKIYVMDISGGNQTRLTHTPGDDVTPRWASYGSAILFSSSRSGDWEIYIMGSDGSNPIQLTYSPGIDKYPTWCPVE